MFEWFFQSAETLPVATIYLVAFLAPFVENLFPPSPSDTVIVVVGSLVAFGTIDGATAFGLATLGSELGFLVLYALGRTADEKVVRSGRFKFISVEAIDRVEKWFRKYGFWLIIGNRFVAGIRSAISFFAGMSKLRFGRTLLLSTLSAALWNGVLFGLGIAFGENVKTVDRWIATYSYAVIGIVATAAIVFAARYYILNKRNKAA
ncbi:MAG: hypothetical protein GF419_02215 [Ignavibacteriales bacterium]|nr:hypothetical protein [Ignavibacteriales bacterium]